MTAVTALLALVLTGCAPAERVEENTTITLGRHGLSFVVPKDFRQADESLVRARIEEDLKRIGTTPDDAVDGGTKRTGKKGGAGTPAVALRDATKLERTLLDSFEAYLVDPVTESSQHPDTVAVALQQTPVTTGTASIISAALATVKGIGALDVLDQSTKAGPVVRASYQVTVGKNADGDDLEVSFETIQLGLDDTTSLQITVSSMDEGVARDLADTVVASLAPTG